MKVEKHTNWRVLLVDPNEENYKDTQRILKLSREWQFDLEWVSSFNDAKQKLVGERYDAILIDYEPDEHIGTELIQSLVKEDYPAPLILLTKRDHLDVDGMAIQPGRFLRLTRDEVTPLLLERTLRYAIQHEQSEQELKRSEERFSKAFQGSPDAMLISRLSDLVIVEVNQSFERNFGFTSEEVVGKTSFELNLFLNPAERQRSIDLMRQMGFLRDFEVKIYAHSGEILNVSLSIETIMIHGEEYILTIAHNVTDRKQMENALRASEERYRTFFENLRDSVFILKVVRDPQGQIIDWTIQDANPAMLKIFGSTREELIGRRALEGSNPDDAALQMKRYTEALESGAPITYENIHQGRNYKTSVFRMSEDTIAITGLDVTEQKQAERAVRESEERFRVALEHAPIFVFSLDRQQRFTWIYNPVMGLTAQEVIGVRPDQLWSPDDVITLTDFLQQVLDSQKSRSEELHLPTNGEWEYTIITAKPTYDDTEAVSGLIGAAMDISEIRRLQAQQVETGSRMKAQHLLMEYRERERLQLARILHDEPLQSLIAAQMELSQVDELPRNGSEENLETAQELLSKTINDIRMLALDLRPPTLMHLGLAKALRAYVASFNERNPGIRVVENLPEEGHFLTEDARLTLYRIFQELMNNIAKHAQATEIHVKMEVEADEVVLEVKDNGKGFEPPSQWIDLAYGGHLGLVGVYERLEVIHGHLELTSLPGLGTCVKVSIPIKPS